MLTNQSVKIHQPHEQKIKTGAAGPKLDKMDMQNNPFRAMIQDGHMLNESYKQPAPNREGLNHSYMHPHGGKSQQKSKTPVAPPHDTKNSF